MSPLISDAQGNISFEVRFKQKTVTWWNMNYLSVNVKFLYSNISVPRDSLEPVYQQGDI